MIFWFICWLPNCLALQVNRDALLQQPILLQDNSFDLFVSHDTLPCDIPPDYEVIYPETHVLDRWCSKGDDPPFSGGQFNPFCRRSRVDAKCWFPNHNKISFQVDFPDQMVCNSLDNNLFLPTGTDLPFFRKLCLHNHVVHSLFALIWYVASSSSSACSIPVSCFVQSPSFSCSMVKSSWPMLSCYRWCRTGLYRIGEAMNPGPQELSIKSCNPTTIANRTEDFEELMPAIIGVSETAATGTVQGFMSSKFRDIGLSSQWSAPVPSYASSSSNIRGIAGGAAVLSPFPIRKSCEAHPDDILASNRFCEAHVQFRPHRFMSVISLYGPTDHFKYGDPNMVLNRLFNYAAQRAVRFVGPAVIMGDLNAPLSRLEAWPFLKSQGWIDAAEVSSDVNNHQLEMTYFEASRHTFILVNRTLGQSLISCRTVFHHLFAGHPVLDAKFDLDTLLSPVKVWDLPKSFDRFIHDPDIAEQSACTGALANKDAICRAIEDRNVDKLAKIWTQIAEKTLCDSAVTPDGHKQYVKPGHLGRATKDVFKQIHANVPLSKRARNGDYQPLHDQCSVELRRCAKQLHRLQSLTRQVSCLQHKFNFTALNQAQHLWQCIYNAHGFRNGFVNWALEFAGLFIPKFLPPLSLLVELRDSFAAWHSANDRQAWFAKTRIKSLDIIADLSKGGKLAFQQVKSPSLPPLTQIHEKITFPIRRTAWSKEGEVILYGGPFAEVSLNLPVKFQNQTTQVVSAKSNSIKVHDPLRLKSVLPQDMILEQERIVVEPESMHSSLCRAWNTFFQRDNPASIDSLSETENSLLNRILPENVMDLPDITGVAIFKAISATKVSSGRGSDGFSTLDLKKLPLALLDMLAVIFKQVELFGCWPAKWTLAKTICLPKSSSAKSPYDIRPVTVMARMYRIWGKIRGKQVSKILSESIPPEIGGPCKGVAADMVSLLTSFKIEKSCLDQEVLTGIVVDIVKCYNTVPRGVLLHLLTRLGTPPTVVRAFKAMMQQMQRFFELLQSCSDLHITTTGIIEGCGFAIPSMLSLGILAYRVLQVDAPDCECAFFADNWSLFSNDVDSLARGFETLKGIVSDLSMKIAPSKSWSWATKSSARKALQTLCVDNQPVPVLSQAKDLGVQQCYTKKKSKAVFSERLQKAKKKLAVIKKAKVPRGCKKRLSLGAGLACTAYGTSVHSVALKDSHALRVCVSKALSRAGPGSNAFLACNSVDTNLDPEMRFIVQRFNLWRRFLRTFPIYQVFVLMSMHSLQITPAIQRRIGSLHSFVASILLLGGKILNTCGLILLGDHKFVWTEVSPKFLSFVIHQAWIRHVVSNRINRNGFSLTDFDAGGNSKAYEKLNHFDRALVDSFVSGRHCTNNIVAKYMPGVLATCSLCNSPDSRQHRLFECPALSKFRQGKIGLRRAARWPESNRLFGLCPAIPCVQDRLVAIQSEIPYSLPSCISNTVTVFTDGSAFFADIKQLTISASAFIVTEPGIFNISDHGDAIVPGPEQNSFVAELFAIILVLNRFYSVHIYTDCQSLCDLLNLAVNGQCVKQEIGSLSFSLWEKLMLHISKRPCNTIKISKVKAHSDHRSIVDPISKWKAWANNQVDRIAKDVIRVRFVKLFRKLDRVHRQVSVNRRDIFELFSFWALASHKCIQADIKKRKERCEPNSLDCTKPGLAFSTTGRSVAYNFSRDMFLCFPWGSVFLWRILAWAGKLKWPTAAGNCSRDISFAEMYIDFQLTTGSRVPRNVFSSKERDKFGFSKYILDDVEARADSGCIEFSFQCETWTRAISWLIQHSPEGFFPAGVVKRAKSLTDLGCSAWYKGLDVRPCLVHGHKAATILHGFFISSSGTHRYMRRHLDFPLPKISSHPQWLDLDFSSRVQLMKRSKDIFESAFT